MPNPKRRHSNQRTRKRRTHQKVTPAAASICVTCGKERIPHRVCPHCGYYKGKPILSRKAAKA
ncbi:MAG: 50S ribosomal protein L32 [Candidatus Omnitrophica bacterium]|nr:50S ribosomal protein L32 [Candidatus Omnitrophota bacterium]